MSESVSGRGVVIGPPVAWKVTLLERVGGAPYRDPEGGPSPLLTCGDADIWILAAEVREDDDFPDEDEVSANNTRSIVLKVTTKAISVAIQARHGSAHVPVEEALLWPTQALLTLLQQVASEEAAKSLQTRHDNRRAGKSAKYARGILAAVALAYREGETVGANLEEVSSRRRRRCAL